eukprot:Skav225689  [mRNA]  locus=scaffold2526:48397:52710:+ [translate_table: standard]
MNTHEQHKHATHFLGQLANTFEHAYDKTVRDLNHILSSDHRIVERTNKHDKRLHPRKPKVARQKHAPSRGRVGDYEPPFETYHIRELQLVKQTRRVQALARRLQKLEHVDASMHVQKQNVQEWLAITQTCAFKPSFSVWCLRKGLVDLWFHDVPPSWWVQILFLALKVVADDMITRSHEAKRKHFQFKVNVDLLHFGGAIASAAIKERRSSSPVAFEITCAHDARLVRQQGKSVPLIHVDNHLQLLPQHPVQIRDKNLSLKETPKPGEFAVPGLPSEGPANFKLFQKTMSNNPDLVSKAFFEFWAPFWLRDQEGDLTTPEAWQEFLGMMHTTPKLEEYAQDRELSLAEWTFAIHRTKPATARGICGFSQPELASLHPSLLNKLVHAINSLSSVGFPAWMMLAKVLLVPKTEESTCIPKMRPITVFSLIFRVWAKTLARRLLLRWKMTLPPNIVGAVPGRSCSQLSLEAAARVERKLQLGCEAGGFSLDIEKCFNAFGRLPVSLLMQYHGMGHDHAMLWLQSLKGMSRTAVLLDSFSEPSPCTTGLAEGDPLAVCVMVLVGYTWHVLVSSCVPIWTSIFADDWQWHADEPQHHIAALRQTIAFLKALKLTMDPHKSWSWGTTPKARKAWNAINLAVVGSPKYFTITRTEKVLGVCLHFAKQTQHGCLAKRLEDGLVRLDRLSKLRLPLTQSARLIQSTIWPRALYGAEVVYVGKKHFTKLRSHAAAVMMKKTAATSNLLAMEALTHRVRDPFLFAAIRALCLWRRIFALDKENRSMYVAVLRDASDNPHSAYGPASTLKCYLTGIGWCIADDGRIHDHLDRLFFLDEVTPAFLVSALRDTWDSHITRYICERKGFGNWPEVDMRYTQRVTLPDDARQAAILVKLRTLGTLFATQREHWEGHEEWISGTCPLCSAPDTREHFPFNCSGTLDLRREYARTLERITMEYPHCCFLPVVHKHPKHSILQHLHYKREMPACFSLTDFHFPTGVVPTFYTDGSAAFPTLGGQLAAWAIVIDLCHSDEQRAKVVLDMTHVHMTPTTLHPVQISLVSGAQTINRAELQAILQIIRSTDAANIFTDSAWAMDVLDEVRLNPDPNAYWARDHSDLLQELCCLAVSKDLFAFRCFKIKSHQNLTSVMDDPLAAYHVMGNRFADELAKRATTRDNSPLHKFSWEVAEWYNRQLELLRAAQPFLARAEILRLDAMQRSTPNPDLATTEAFTVEHAILWSPPNLFTIPTFEPCQRLLAAFQPSPGALLQVIKWAGTLQWPSEDTTSGGVSWFELLVNFLMITHCKIPVIVERKVQHPQYRDHHVHSDAVMFSQTVWDCVRFLQNSLQYIHRFTGRELVPLKNQKTRWYLSAYGYRKRISGLQTRCVFPKQLQHIAVLKSAISADALSVPDCSHLECWFPRTVIAEDSLTHRQKYLNHRSLAHFVKTHGPLSA